MTIDATQVILAIVGIVIAIIAVVSTLVGIIAVIVKWLTDELAKANARAMESQKVFIETMTALVKPIGIILENSTETEAHLREVREIVERIQKSRERKS